MTEYDSDTEYEEYLNIENDTEFWGFYDGLKQICDSFYMLNNCRYVDLHQFIYHYANEDNHNRTWLNSHKTIYSENRMEATRGWLQLNNDCLDVVIIYIESFFNELKIRNINKTDIINFIYSYS